MTAGGLGEGQGCARGEGAVPMVLGGQSPLGHASCAGESIAPFLKEENRGLRRGGVLQRGAGVPAPRSPSPPPPTAQGHSLGSVPGAAQVPAQSWP